MTDLSTPTARTGPTSRILRRKSGLLSQQQQQPTPPPQQKPSSLERSLSILDDALGSQRRKPLSRTPYRLMGDSSLFPIPGGGSILQDRWTNLAEASAQCLGDLSKSATYHPMDSTLNSANIMAEENPGVAATENLFVDFLATTTEPMEGVQVLDQVAEFEQLVGDHYEVLRNILNKYPRAATKFKTTEVVKKNLLDERNTWRLLGKLYHDRLAEKMDEDDDEVIISHSERRIVEHLFRHDADLRQAQAIVDWLESNTMDEDVVDLRHKMEHFSDSTIGWENTLNALIHGRDQKREMVDSMDPDAQRRQNKPLHDLDMQDQSLLHDAIFFCVRLGMLDSAQELCIKVGQPWRAATFEGWKLYHDPNYETASEDGKKFPAEGNRFRDVWKRSAWKMTQDEKMPQKERASYSALCGNLKQLLTVCNSWDDCLWALTRCYVDFRVESEIRERMPRSFADLPQEYWDCNYRSMTDVLEAMETLDKEFVKLEKKSPYKIIQSHLITGDLKGLVLKMTEWVSQPQEPHLLRLLAHLVIIFRRLGVGPEGIEEDEDAILERYVIYLMETDKVQQVAWYTSQLPRDQQIDLYSKFLGTVASHEDRKLCLDLGMESSLPVQEITVQVVINIRMQEEADDEMTFQPTTTETDRIKIDALSWLIFFEEQRAEAVFQANALIRAFIASGKIEAAREALSKLPGNSIDLITSQFQDDMPVRISNAVREFLCLEVYLQAQEAFNDWFTHYSKGKPRKPVLPEKASFVENVAFEQREEQYQIEMERWNAAQLIQSREATQKLEAVLTFPHGWLLDEHEEEKGENSDDNRLEETLYLRQICLPKLVLLLHSVLHNTRQYQEAIKLSDLIAAERYGIYKVYNKETMREFLSKIRESSLAAMDSGSTDPWGYPKK